MLDTDKLKPFILPGVAALVLLGWWVLAPKPAPEPGSAGAPVPTLSAAAPGESHPAQPGTTARTDRPEAAKAALPSPKPDPARRAARDDMLRRIEAALDARRRAPGAPTNADGPAETLDEDYIRQRVQEDLVPVAKECYQAALGDDPELAGQLIMEFVIVGDESVGGVVAESEIAEDSDIRHAALRECMRESTFTLTFPPPPGGGRMLVRYPLRFASEESETTEE